ncbi:hypothetical protein [Candidatus Nanohalobium constans]|uniref:Uncharacterized protein n=1 Tax=Candidatus Nanohalobium constans TaxID=2565781 RepID=A0A5Q0UH25_9ARCH|nr:hypothetical protein [Candidatus Nanohalobium constans]QGA80886.1 hypothetical protein LC1Nh_1010 [Candidatus Nanohalobium constans]
MNIEQMKQDLEHGKNLSNKDAVWNHRENPEKILLIITKLCINEPNSAFSTKEIKEEYREGMEAEVSNFLKTHEKWNPISWFAQQQTTGKIPEKSRDTLERWYETLERRHVNGYYHYKLPEELREKLEDNLDARLEPLKQPAI